MLAESRTVSECRELVVVEPAQNKEVARKLPEAQPDVRTITTLIADELIHVTPAGKSTFYGDFQKIRTNELQSVADKVVEMVAEHFGRRILSIHPYEKLVSGNELAWGLMIGLMTDYELDEEVIHELEELICLFAMELTKEKPSKYEQQDLFCQVADAQIAVQAADEFLKENSGKRVQTSFKVCSGDQSVDLKSRYFVLPEEDPVDLGFEQRIGKIDNLSYSGRTFRMMNEGKKVCDVRFAATLFDDLHQNHGPNAPMLKFHLKVQEKRGSMIYTLDSFGVIPDSECEQQVEGSVLPMVLH